MKWNQKIFNNNIECLIDNKCDGIQNRFNEKLGRDAATRWKKSRPSLENLLAITEEFDCSMEWLLTGKEQQENCYVECGDKLKILCEKVKKVLNSKTPYAAALESNILCFEDSINIRRELENIKAVQSEGHAGDMPK